MSNKPSQNDFLRDRLSRSREINISVTGAVTSMSPLHFQKVPRLQEARRLVLSAAMDTGATSQRVGYLSASQFSREYSRCFGSALTRDIAGLRNDSRPLD
ncbi:MAG: hypothetical protein ACRD51_06455 [Candidatus Acidiferrum sp.]